jgi:hypothetical protein
MSKLSDFRFGIGLSFPAAGVLLFGCSFLTANKEETTATVNR